MSDTVANNTVALICDGECRDGMSIKKRIDTTLCDKGFSPWPCAQAEIFTYHGKTLIIARPLLPLIFHPLANGVRLKRKRQ